MSYLNQDACAPSESSPPVKAACKREEGTGNAGRVLKLPLVSKALYLGLSYVRAHIPPLLGLFLFLPFPVERLAGHPHWGMLPGRTLQPRGRC